MGQKGRLVESRGRPEYVDFIQVIFRFLQKELWFPSEVSFFADVSLILKEPISSPFSSTLTTLTCNQNSLKEDGRVSLSVSKRPYANRKSMHDVFKQTTA